MEIMDKLYNYLGIKENKELCKKLATNYLLFILLFMIVSVFVYKTSSINIPKTPVFIPKKRDILPEKQNNILTSREEALVEKLRSASKLELRPRVKLSDGLL